MFIWMNVAFIVIFASIVFVGVWSGARECGLAEAIDKEILSWFDGKTPIEWPILTAVFFYLTLVLLPYLLGIGISNEGGAVMGGDISIGRSGPTSDYY